VYVVETFVDSFIIFLLKWRCHHLEWHTLTAQLIAFEEAPTHPFRAILYDRADQFGIVGHEGCFLWSAIDQVLEDGCVNLLWKQEMIEDRARTIIMSDNHKLHLALHRDSVLESKRRRYQREVVLTATALVQVSELVVTGVPLTIHIYIYCVFSDMW